MTRFTTDRTGHPRPSFADDVERFTTGPRWVIEWQYTEVRALLLDRADILIWLDHGRWTVTHRVVRRTVGRRIRRIELWNGNYEPPLWTIFTDPRAHHSLVVAHPRHTSSRSARRGPPS